MGRAIHNNSITIAKAIGIILMVVGHAGCPQFLFDFIYLFHMPLFFFCSGIFFKEITTTESAFGYLKKRIRGLYIPFLKWSILFLLLHNLLMLVGIYNPYYGFEGGSSYYSITEIFQKLFLIVFTMHDYEELLGGFWFLRALFISSLLIAVVSLLFRKKMSFKYELVCLLFLFLTIVIRRFAANPEFWRDMSMGALGAMFYMSGYLSKQYDHIWRNRLGIILCFIFLCVSWFYFKEGVSMGCGYNKVVIFSVSAISGSLLILYLSKLIEDNVAVVRNALYYIGNHTLEILALHFFTFRLVSCGICLLYGLDLAHVAEHPVVKEGSADNSFWWILYVVVGVVVPLFINKVWQFSVNAIKERKVCR